MKSTPTSWSLPPEQCLPHSTVAGGRRRRRGPFLAAAADPPGQAGALQLVGGQAGPLQLLGRQAGTVQLLGGQAGTVQVRDVLERVMSDDSLLAISENELLGTTTTDPLIVRCSTYLQRTIKSLRCVASSQVPKPSHDGLGHSGDTPT